MEIADAAKAGGHPQSRIRIEFPVERALGGRRCGPMRKPRAAALGARIGWAGVRAGQDSGAAPISWLARKSERMSWVHPKDTWLLRETVTESLDYQIDGRVVAHQEHRSEGAQRH